MPERKKWTYDETIIAFNLYCKLPFGQLHHNNPEVKKLATLLERTPSSVSMKLCNFAALDPALQKRGIKGLTNISRLDKQVWEEFHADWSDLVDKSEEELLKIGYIEETERVTTTKVRIGQAFFRRTVLASYNYQCAVTGCPVPELLEASHILPWSEYPKERLNPSNGVCLVSHFHKAFDIDLVSFDENFQLVLNEKINDYLPNPFIEKEFIARKGIKARLPERFQPEKEFLKKGVQCSY
jgi:putative restriction endonuclease